jgi:hypothetical protein
MRPPKNVVKKLFCNALPQGRVVSLNGSIGILGGEQGSVQQIVNYNSGEVSDFATGGVQVGWNGGAGASVSAGLIYDTQGRFATSDFSGPFSNVSGSTAEGPGGSASWSGGVKVVQGSVGVSLIPGATGNYSYTWTSKPLPAGNIWTNLSNPLGGLDLSLYLLRKLGGLLTDRPSDILMLFNLPVLVILCLAGSCAMISSFLLWQEIGEVNRKTPEGEQISYWGMYPAKMARVKREYLRLYPTGRIDLMRRIFQYAAFACLFLLLIPLGFFK